MPSVSHQHAPSLRLSKEELQQGGYSDKQVATTVTQELPGDCIVQGGIAQLFNAANPPPSGLSVDFLEVLGLPRALYALQAGTGRLILYGRVAVRICCASQCKVAVCKNACNGCSTT